MATTKTSVKKEPINELLGVSEKSKLLLGVIEKIVMVPSLYMFWSTMSAEEYDGIFIGFFPTFEIFKKYIELMRENSISDLRNTFYTIIEWWNDSHGSDNSIFEDFDAELYVEVLDTNFSSM